MTHAVLRLLRFHNEWGNMAINLNGSVRMEIIPLPLPHLGYLASHEAPSSPANWLLNWEIKGLVFHGTKCDSAYINVYSIYVNWSLAYILCRMTRSSMQSSFIWSSASSSKWMTVWCNALSQTHIDKRSEELVICISKEIWWTNPKVPMSSSEFTLQMNLH